MNRIGSNLGSKIFLVFALAIIILVTVMETEGTTNCGTTTSYTNCTAYGCIIIRDSTSNTRALFDGYGNIDLEGNLTQSSVGTPDGNDFIIRNNVGTTVAWINDANGAMRLASTATDVTGTTCTPPANSFIVRNKTGSCVAYISSAGALWARGVVCYNANI